MTTTTRAPDDPPDTLPDDPSDIPGETSTFVPTSRMPSLEDSDDTSGGGDTNAVEAELTEQAPASDAQGDEEGSARDGGVPAGQIVVGGVTASSVVLGGLYQLSGVIGLVGGAVFLGVGGLAYLYHRYGEQWRTRATSSSEGGGSSASGGSGRWGGRPFGASGLFGGGRSRWGGLLSGGRSGAAGASVGGGRRRAQQGSSSTSGGAKPSIPSRLLGRRGGASGGGPGRSSGSSNSGSTPRVTASGRRTRRNRSSRGGSTARGGTAPTSGKGSASRSAARARRVLAAAAHPFQAAARGSNRLERALHSGSHRSARFAGRHLRRGARGFGAFVDRCTGRRLSAAWRASQGAAGFHAARRRAAAAGWAWDAQLTASVIAVITLITGRWRARKNRRSATDNPATSTDEQQGAAASATTPPTADPATPAGNRRRRRHPYTPPRGAPRRSFTMSGFPLAAAAAEMNAAAASYAPEDMWAVARELDQLPELPGNVALALRTYTARLQGDYPIHPAVIEKLAQLYLAHTQLVRLAAEVGPLFKQVHADDLKREEAPRTGEPMWNV